MEKPETIFHVRENERQHDLLRFTSDIVCAHLARGMVQKEQLPELIASVHGALSNLGQAAAPKRTEPLVPAVNPKRSVHLDYIISLEDGRKFKSMKRHLGLLGMTPDQYREKWGLPKDYPMVAPNYAEKRSQLAKASGLGRKPGERPRAALQ
jgi:predicted transcriptional regulator